MRRAAGPPFFSRALIRGLLPPRDRDCALSDLVEEFERRCARDGHAAARRWYRQQLWMSVAPGVRQRAVDGLARMRRSVSQAGGPMLASEFKWAWRGVLARGWRAAFVVVLFGVALAANAIVFAAADAFVFRTLPYHDPDTLVVIERTGRSSSDYIRPQAFREWRHHRDLFASVQAHSSASSAWITESNVTEAVRAAQLTPGFLEMLGVLPGWGRPFVEADAVKGAPPVVILGETIARRLFGDPSAALGQSFFTGRRAVTVVGVMPSSFRFPTAREAMWEPLDLASWPNNSGIRNVARLASGQTLDAAAATVAVREAAVSKIVERWSRDERMRLRAMVDVWGNSRATGVFAMLLGAAACLLLIACANVASLELAAAARRVRVYAVQTALGASRASLVRVGLAEGASLLGASAALAIVLTGWGVGILDAQLTAPMRDALTNPLDLDVRAIVFMTAIAAATWMLTSMPALLRVSRLSVVDALRDDPRTMPVSRGAARTRQLLMAGQVALTALLLASAFLYVRAYADRAGLDKGFDATNLVSIAVSPGPDAPKTGADLEQEILDRLRATPFIRSVSLTDSPPPTTQSGTMAPLTIEGRPPTNEWIMLHLKNGDPDYFKTMDIRIVQGRPFDATTRPDQIVIDERFARRFWPDGSALGARFRLGSTGNSGVNVYEVIGVSRELRPDRLTNDRGEEVFLGYFRISPTYHPLTFAARVDDESRVADLTAIVRSLAPRSLVRVNTVSELYALLDADIRLAAAVTSGFGAMAFIVAVSGIYAVIAYLVAGRAKEIAIRMALGADRNGVRRMVLQSSLGFVIVGAIVGVAAAVLAAQATSAQLAGITATDSRAYAAALGVLMAAALAAAWWPARRASRVDPAVTLRAE